MAQQIYYPSSWACLRRYGYYSGTTYRDYYGWNYAENSGVWIDQTGTEEVGLQRGKGTDNCFYYIWRLAFEFDTSGLSADTVINSAWFYICVDYKNVSTSYGDRKVQVIVHDSDFYSSISLSKAIQVAETTIDGLPGSSTWYSVYISPDLIQKAGKRTKIQIKVEEKRYGDPDETPSIYEYAAFRTPAYSGYSPYLVVTYTPPTWTGPNAPTGCNVYFRDSKNVVSWSPPFYAAYVRTPEYYTVQRKIDSGSYSDLTNSTSTAIEDSNISPNHTYTYRVKSYASGYSSDFSNEASITINKIQDPTLTAVFTGSSCILTWTVPQAPFFPINHYHVYRSTNGTDYSLIQDNLATNTWTNTGLSSGQTYYYKVCAVDSKGVEGNFSNICSGQIYVPNAPTSLIAYSQKIDRDWKIVVQWSPPAINTNPISKYKLYRRKEGESAQLVNDSVIQTIYYDTVNDKTPKARYYYYVKAVDTGNFESGASNEDSVVIGEPERVTGVRAVPSDGSVTLYWASATPGITALDHYEIWYKEKPSESLQLLVDNLNANELKGDIVTSYTISGLTNGKRYYFAIKAIDEVGLDSEFSDIISAMPYWKPNPPRNLIAIQHHLKVYLGWDLPAE